MNHARIYQLYRWKEMPHHEKMEWAIKSGLNTIDAAMLIETPVIVRNPDHLLVRSWDKTWIKDLPSYNWVCLEHLIPINPWYLKRRKKARRT